MNPILEKWLVDKEAEVKKTRKLFLIEQGIVDPSKTTTIYKDVLICRILGKVHLKVEFCS